jgi:diguanylate cyclase (GGDEF)-like protein
VTCNPPWGRAFVAVPRIIESVGLATSHRDRDDLDAAVARMVASFLNAQVVTVYRLLHDGDVTRVARRISLRRDGAELGPEDHDNLDALPTVNSELAWRECVLLHDIVHDEAPAGRGWRSVFPLEGEGGVCGMLEIIADEGLRSREASLVTGILRIVHNHLKLLDYGERDTLTGLLNRKTFETTFGKMLARPHAASRDPTSGDPSWLAVIDIDHFKSINDTFGHLFGDEVLLLVARLIRTTFRGADQLFRFGGEEFVIVLDRAVAAGADAAFDRLRIAIQDYSFPQVGSVTVSVGYTAIRPHDAPASCMERADAALYHAKRNGRNQSHNYEHLLECGKLKAKQSRSEVELF